MAINNKIQQIFRAKFQKHCLNLLISAYRSSINEKSISIDWDENDITAQLNDYIEENPQRKKYKIVTNVEQFLPKKNEIKKTGFAAKRARIDLRFVTINSDIEYKYFLEAKNLKQNDSALKRRYINTGINNFLSKKYRNGCLVGYLLKGNLDLTIKGINSLLISKDNRPDEILKREPNSLHKHYFESTHTENILKHYIFDFTILLD